MILPPSSACVELVKEMESFLPVASKADGHWTYGYGTHIRPDGSRVQEGEIITKSEATELLAHLLLRLTTEVLEKQLPGTELKQNEVDALCSLIYNIGEGNFAHSTVRAKLLSGAFNEAADAFLMWDRFRTKPLRGLIRSRHTERFLFLGKSLKEAIRDGYLAIGRQAGAEA